MDLINSPLKIALFISNFHDYKIAGPQKVGFTLVKHLINNNVNVLVITNDITRQQRLVLSREKYDVLILPGDSTFVLYLRYFLLIYFTLKKYSPVIIHGHGYSSSLLTFIMGKILNISTVQTMYDLPLFSKFPKKMQLCGLFFIDYILCTSKYIKQYLSKMGIKTNKINVLPYGIEDRWFSTKMNNVLNREKTIVLYYGDANKERGIDIMLDAIIDVNKICSNIKYIFAIRRYADQYLNEVILRSKIINVELIMKYENHISYLVDEADVIILPYRKTTMQPPLTLIESMLLGKIIITTDVESNKEYIGANERGILLEHNDTISFKKAMISLIKNKERYKDMGTSARLFIQKIYDWESIMTKLLTIYSFYGKEH